MTSPNDLLTVDEAAERLRISPRYLNTITQSGELPSLLIGRRRLYRHEDIEAFIAERVGQ